MLVRPEIDPFRLCVFNEKKIIQEQVLLDLFLLIINMFKRN